MYSNDLTQIRSGLINYIGACVSASPYEGKAARHTVVSIMMEESLKLSQEKEGEPFDLYVLKPMLRATALVMKKRITELEGLELNQEIISKIGDYGRLVKELNGIIDHINS